MAGVIFIELYVHKNVIHQPHFIWEHYLGSVKKKKQWPPGPKLPNPPPDPPPPPPEPPGTAIV